MVWEHLDQQLKHLNCRVNLTWVGLKNSVQQPNAFPKLANLNTRQLCPLSELAAWLGHQPEQISSQETALLVAVKTFQADQLLTIQLSNSRPIAMGCVLPTESDSPCWLAMQTENTTHAIELAEPDLVSPSRLGSRIALALSQLDWLASLRQFAGGVRFRSQQFALAEPRLIEVWHGETPSVWRMPSGVFTPKIDPTPTGIFAGSFNPLHHGHRELRQTAEDWLNTPVAYEMAITNADKPPLDFLTISKRLEQFSDQAVWLTNAATFVEKAELLPGSVFVVGADTALRIIHPRFYDGSESLMNTALTRIQNVNSRFLVAGRLANGGFLTRSQIPIPKRFNNLFETLPESAFRLDVSSTDIRKHAQVRDVASRRDTL